jgi:hypothetical protein
MSLVAVIVGGIASGVIFGLADRWAGPFNRLTTAVIAGLLAVNVWLADKLLTALIS